ncbi:hypothetical protein JRO89_XS14G0041200 [Xanthoceras sorbifolium]|uniref:Uncharacterized protein n=1 Tax=Xanthoceras sorbifolium TaxID=99658 RepID=A0ABQ8H3R0_9ROSI|nr:hypothetical protein JRO89_XS14G0041200 [Xanthoceras sorbifolium]
MWVLHGSLPVPCGPAKWTFGLRYCRNVDSLLSRRMPSKLSNFRIKELKDILTKLGLPKQGRKQLFDAFHFKDNSRTLCLHQDLVDRIQHVLLDERVAEIIDATYRKMQNLDDVDLATNEHSASVLSDVNLKMEVEDSLNSNTKICCPCGNSLPSESMIQCVDPRCLVQQHTTCVIIPENSMEENSPISPFFCEMCRIKRADPFWVTVAHLVSPVKLKNVPTTDGTNTLLNVENTFHLTKAHRELLQNTEYDVQLLPCRLGVFSSMIKFLLECNGHNMQIYKLMVCNLVIIPLSYINILFSISNSNLSSVIEPPQGQMSLGPEECLHRSDVFRHPIPTVNRPASQLLGANGRDNGALITLYITEGVNKISLSGCVRNFCFGVRLVKRRTVDKILSIIPKATEGESFEDALARVRRCIGGGMATGNEDSDSDLEVITDSIKVNLRCPNLNSILGLYIIIVKNVHKVFHFHLARQMRNCEEDITEIEVKPDGSWIVKAKGELGDLAQWHLPDGSECVARNGLSNSEMSRQIKKEDSSGCNNLTVGMRNNPSETLQVSKHQPITLSRKNQVEDSFENYGEKLLSMSSSATGSGRDNEDLSIDTSTNNVNEINFVARNFDSTFGTPNQTSLTKDRDIIILSDSEEENVKLVSPQTVYNTFSVIDNAPSGFSDSYLQDPALVAGTSSCLGLFSGNNDDVGMSNWPYTCGTRTGSGFQLFGTDADVPDAFIDMDHSSVTCSAPMNDYTSASKSAIRSTVEVLDSSVCHTNLDIDVALIDNPLAFVHDDPSLQNFLPIQPSVALSESVMGHQLPTSNGIHSNDWISLRLSSNGEPIHGAFHGDVRAHSLSDAADGLELSNRCESNGAAVVSGEPKSNTTNNRKLSDGPFSFPRQPRSVRQRAHPSQIRTPTNKSDSVILEEGR